MGNAVRDYAQELMRNQCTCVNTRDQLNVIKNAELMDECINRGWKNKLARMRITRYDGYLKKVHDFALRLVEK